ncbi:hypothetical protein [Streptomyces galilaeus]|uniref:hypothetical protein n=1 Tax=Streptomyces galilaeus TaxID=33899 RepID=UPI0038F69D6A
MTDQPERFPGIQGRCPACRGASLFAGSGGHVTCRRIDCPNPSAADDLLHASSPAPALDAPLRDQLQAAIKALGTSETLLARARAACDQLERAVTNADGRLLTPYDRGVDTAIRRVRKVLDQPAPAPTATEATEHHYLSTGCLHGDHGYCQGMTGIAGSKRPGECKFCRAPCRCICHQTRH